MKGTPRSWSFHPNRDLQSSWSEGDIPDGAPGWRGSELSTSEGEKSKWISGNGAVDIDKGKFPFATSVEVFYTIRCHLNGGVFGFDGDCSSIRSEPRGCGLVKNAEAKNNWQQ